MNITIFTNAFVNFRFAIDDAEMLLKLHDAETKRRPGRPSRQIEALKRAAIILAVTAWESFVEDTIHAQADERIRTAASPRDVQHAFNLVADAWLRESPKPPSVAEWSGDEWKSQIRKRLLSDLQKLNTPNSENIRKLSKTYLNMDITTGWAWARTSPAEAAGRLDGLIRLRGDLVHRGPELFSGAAVRRRQASDAVRLVERLVKCTETSLGVEPRRV